MKLKTHTNPVESNGIKEISAFQIKTSPTAFRILSSGLYSNKIKAIIREVSCNAADSHVAAGTPELPFEVHLPNGIEPHFSIRDFGIGLPHDEVMGLYTTYFNSTKADSNEYTGALGLGSKSPFSYTENFTVSSIYDGMKRSYTALIDEAGCPNIALMHEVETTDHNGVEVKFAVTDSNDYFNFKKEAIQVLRWFKVAPTVNLSKDELAAPVLENITDGIDIQLNVAHNTPTVATQGNVAYPLDAGQLRQKRELTSFQVTSLSSGFVLQFPIGDLDVAASRETLEYTEDTIEVIYQKLVKLEAHFTKHVMAELKSAGSKWDTGAVVAKLYSNQIYRNVLSNGLKQLDIHMHEGTQPVFDFDIPDFKKRNLTMMQFVTKHNGVIGRRAHQSRYPKDSKGNRLYTDEIASHSVKWTEEVTLYVNDTTHGASDIIKGHMINESLTDAIVINRIRKTDDTPIEAYQKAVKLMGSPSKCKMVLLSSMILASPKLAPARRTVTSTVHMYILEGGMRYRSVLVKGAGGIDFSDTTKKFYYFPMDAEKYILKPDGKRVDKSFVGNFIAQVASTVLDGYAPSVCDDHIFGVGPRRIAEIEKAANWINAFDGFAEYLNRSCAELSVSQALPSITDRHSYINKELKKTVGLLDKTSPFAAHWNKCQAIFTKAKIDTNRYNTNHIKVEADRFGIEVKEKYQKQIDAALAEYEGIEKRYPIIGMIDFYNSIRDDVSLKLAEYIEMVDVANKADK